MQASVPSSQTELVNNTDTCCASDVHQPIYDDQLVADVDVDDDDVKQRVSVVDETSRFGGAAATDAVVPCASDVQHEAACRVVKYLSQFDPPKFFHRENFRPNGQRGSGLLRVQYAL